METLLRFAARVLVQNFVSLAHGDGYPTGHRGVRVGHMCRLRGSVGLFAPELADAHGGAHGGLTGHTWYNTRRGGSSMWLRSFFVVFFYCLCCTEDRCPKPSQ